jgi:hypothetical protein
MVSRGIQKVGDCVTATGQINTEVIQLIPPAYRAFYVRKLVKYIDATAGRDPMSSMANLPGIREWKLSAVLHTCRQLLTTEERQTSEVWKTLHSQQVPYNLKEFVVLALEKKLPVAQQLQKIQVLTSVGCPLCRATEDHAQVEKNVCIYRTL